MPFGLGFFAVAGAGGAAGSYDLLETQVLGASQASVTFSNLNTNYGSTYKHLQLRIVARMGGTGGARSNTLRFNSDTASNYISHFLIGTGSSVSSFGGGSATRIFMGIGGNLAQTNEFGGSVIDILDAFSTTKNKTVRSFGGLSGGGNEIGLISGLYLSTNATTSLTIIPETADYQIGSRFSLYGIKGA